MTIRLLLVDDDPLVRAGLAMMLQAASDLEVVGEAGSGDGALSAARRLHPDVVLMDIRMPNMDGLEATRQLRRLPEPPQVLVLTTFSADEYVFAALQAGAIGFLLKDIPPRELSEAVRTVASGRAMLAPDPTKALIERFADRSTDRREEAQRELAVLSGREQEVCAAVSRGLSNVEIAQHLYLSDATVKAHLSRIFTKLGRNRVQVAILAHDANLTEQQ